MSNLGVQPLIWESVDDAKHVGTFQRHDRVDDIELIFIPLSDIWIESEQFNRMKNKIVDEFDAGAVWDKTGRITIHVSPADSWKESKITEIKKIISLTYKIELDPSDELMQVVPGIWVLESDLALSHLTKENLEKLDHALAEIFNERPKKLFISTPEV